VTLAAAVVLAACVSTASRSDEPAVITAPTPASRAELAHVVSAALHGAPVTLADDALTKESLLIIERARMRDASGVPIDGRVTEKPEQFELVKSGSQCVLIHRRTGARHALTHTTCAPSRN
jgi:heme A synthase